MTKLKQKRNRGIVLTPIGLKRLKSARLNLESQNNFGERYTYEKISELTSLDINTIKKVLAANEPVDKRSLEKFLIAFNVELNPENYTKPSRSQRQDWAEAVSVNHFFGRADELETLESWLLEDRCRLIALLGMGGIGKTTLSVKLGERVKSKYECIIWKSLRDAPPVEDIIINLIEFISAGTETAVTLPERLGDLITELIKHLRDIRCLIFLDNAESLLDSNARAGKYLSGYEGYGELLRRIGATEHSSSFILTSREKSQEIALLEGKKLAVRSLQINGLQEADGQEILKVKGLVGSEFELNILSDRYTGNPLAMKVVATTIQDLFGGNITEFLKQEQAVFGDIRDILDEQFARLSSLEQEIMYWLAIAREPISLADLKEDFVLAISSIKLLEALESLSRRSLIENRNSCFTQQSVVMEYVTSKLIEVVSQEIISQQPQVLRDHALMKATAKDYIRENQIRLILKPIINDLFAEFRSQKGIEACLRQILVIMQETSPLEKWYVAGNIINLFCQLETDLTGYNFSNLCVWQADLRKIQLHQVNFQNSDLSKSVFAENFGGIWSVAFSPDGQYLAAGDTKGNILLRRVADGQPIGSFKGHNAWVVSLAFSPDGNTLASSSCDCTAKLWNVNTSQCLHSLDEHEHEVWSVAFSPDGNTLATGCDDSKARLWDVNTGECLKVITGHSDYVLSVVFSLDGQQLFSGSHDNTIKQWDLKTNECLKVFQGHDDGVRSIDISSDGQLLVSGSNDKTVRLWNVSTGRCLEVLQGHTNGVWSVHFCLQGQMLASGSIDQTIRLWDVKAKKSFKIFTGHSNVVNSVRFSLDNKILASGSYDQTIKLWNVETFQCIKTWQGYSNESFSLTFKSDSLNFASGCHDQKIRIWNTQTGKLSETLSGHTNWVFSVAFELKSDLLASGSADKAIKIWDINTGKEIRTFWGHEAAVRSVVFCSKKNVLASGSDDRTVKIWDINTGHNLKTLRGHEAPVWSIAFDSDRCILSSASLDGNIRLWDVNTGECLKIFKGHNSWIWSISLSPDNNTLASTSVDKTIRLWDMNTLKCKKIIQSDTGHSQVVAFGKNSQTIAGCDQEHNIKIWNINREELIMTLYGHQALINSIAFCPDGQSLISSSEDEAIKLWDLKTGKCLKTFIVKRPYELMNIKDINNMTKTNFETLISLGAVNT